MSHALLISSDGIYICDCSNEDSLVNLGIKSRLVFAFGILISLPVDMRHELDVIDGRR